MDAGNGQQGHRPERRDDRAEIGNEVQDGIDRCDCRRVRDAAESRLEILLRPHHLPDDVSDAGADEAEDDDENRHHDDRDQPARHRTGHAEPDHTQYRRNHAGDYRQDDHEDQRLYVAAAFFHLFIKADGIGDDLQCALRYRLEVRLSPGGRLLFFGRLLRCAALLLAVSHCFPRFSYA